MSSSQMLCSGGSRYATEKTVSRSRDPWLVDNHVAITVLGPWRGPHPCPRSVPFIKGAMGNEMGPCTIFYEKPWKISEGCKEQGG